MSVADAAIIGAGVVGCAIARRLTLDGAQVIVVEKAHDILDGASKGNSAILHTGFDAPVGSLEQSCVAAGHAEYLEIHERLGLPLMRSGALVLAWTEEEEARLPELIAQARQNGVDDADLKTAAQLLRLEPHLSPKVRAGFAVPREFIIDPWSAPYAYLLQAIANGAVLKRGCTLKSGSYDGSIWNLETTLEPIQARAVINAAGLYGDRVHELLTGERRFVVKPRKGQFVVYDKPAADLVTSILLPVPSKTTKGIVVCRTAFGNLLVGPTAEDQDDRENASIDTGVLNNLKARGEEIVPALRDVDVTAVYAGLRPATEFKDYQIIANSALRLITAGGIRSTGLSSALGLARHISELYESLGRKHTPLANAEWPRVSNICEYAQRSWQLPGNGGIVCHCEKVTRAEIESALSGSLPAQTPAGIKRRTRATLGRCQGFYCTAELAQMTAGRLAQPYAGETHGAR